jgi:hypothetical protein
MDKSAIEKFAVTARVKLRQSVEQRMAVLGIGANGALASVQIIGDVVVVNLNNGMETRLTKEESSHRDQLIKEVIRAGYDNVVESVAYTWFNRLIAIRYMEVNDYLPTHIRVLSSAIPGKKEPDLVSQCLSVDLSFSTTEKERILELKNKEELDRLFVLLFLKQCQELNKILPELFTITRPYENILLKLSFTDPDSVVRDLVDNISEDDFKDAVQIIGWMYQYYNTELKADTFAKLKKNTKISKERIPSATQLFTPDWIVRYMVENSVGRIWLEGHDDLDLRSKWKYYIDEAKQDSEVAERLKDIRKDRKGKSPTSIKVIDPCMGSGHILAYAFDVLMQIYLSYGYSGAESATSIVENNLYGLDVDDRAYQLAYFAVMMKARQYDPKIFEKNIHNNIHSIIETSNITDGDLSGYGNTMAPLDRHSAVNDIKYILGLFKNGKIFGSLIDVRECNWQLIKRFLADRRIDIMVDPTIHDKIQEVVEVAKVLSQKYDIVVTNPPYMGSSGMESELTEYVKSTHPDAKADLFACFIEKVGGITKVYGIYSMITMHAFMFLSSFEKLRNKLSSQTLINMAHLGSHAFDEIGGEVVQTTSFVMMNTDIKGHFGTYIRLVDGAGEAEKERMFFEKERTFIVKQEEFSKIPGAPIAYWVSKQFIDNFSKGISIGSISDYTGSQNITADNEKYLRFFWEVDNKKIGPGKKWVMYAKGGDSRKYYGNLIHVVDWSDSARNYYETNKTSNLLDRKLWYGEGITYTMLSSKGASFRYLPSGCVFDKGGPSILSLGNVLYYALGFLNSNVAKLYLNALNPTINLQTKDVNNLPFIVDIDSREEISSMVQKCVSLSADDWNSNEYSSEFTINQLVVTGVDKVSTAISINDSSIERSRNLMHNLETMINQRFNIIYSLNEKEESSIDLNEVDAVRDIKNLISYAVGCMFGRYSLDNKGLVYTGGKWDPDVYKIFKADSDNIIPINDDEYFGDDVVTKFVEFIQVAFGKEHLDENIKFIADNLGIKSSGTSKDKIRKYFLNDFYKDHLKMYQKRPIYWLFDSGKENGFKALIYMHRYDENLIGKMRQNYLLPMQRRYIDQLNREKDQVKRGIIQKKLTEVERYDMAMELYSSNPVSIDLDDGVKVNYAKFQNIENSKSSKDKIDLLYKI